MATYNAAAKRVLVVDDDVDFADSLAELLRAEGLRVDVAYSARDALELMRERAFDLTLVDMKMPEQDGVDSLHAIRRRDPGARVVMMTGYSLSARMHEAMAGGAAGILQKPLDLAHLRTLIDHEDGAPLVLVVEDDSDLAESLRGILEAHGCSVMAAGDGREAVRRAIARRPDALLLDLRLPGMGGVAAYCELARRGLELPTIVLSAYVDEERHSLDQLAPLPEDQILHKPVDATHLLRIVDRVITAR